MKERITAFLLCSFLALPCGYVLAGEGKDRIDALLEEGTEMDGHFGDGNVSDPFEPMNRVFFQVNDSLYTWVLKPVNKVYTAALPLDFRECLSHFFDNVASPVRVVNNALQGKVENAVVDLGRFVINSTVGVLGLGDPALRSFGLEPHPSDFGLTLGVWGVGEGPYLVMPLVGPLTARDAVGFAGNAACHPATYIFSTAERAAYMSTDKLNMLSLNPTLYDDMKRYSLDSYASMRQVYLDYRRGRLRNKDVKNNIIDEL